MRYRFGNLRVDSEIELPLLEKGAPNGETSDLVFRAPRAVMSSAHDIMYDLETTGAVRLSRLLDRDGVGFCSYGHVGSVYLLWVSAGLGFRIHADTATVEVICVNSEATTLVPWFLMGVVFGYVLHLRGVLCLHASVLERDGKCIAFLGTNKRGKSTLTAFMVRRGWSLFSDDLLCIDDLVGPVIRPCFPFMKLDQDVINYLSLRHTVRTAIPHTTKEAVAVDGKWGSFTTCDSGTIDCIYVLHRIKANGRGEAGENLHLSECSGPYSRSCLMSNGYGVGFWEAKARRRFVDVAAELAPRVSVWKLGVPWGFSYLDEVASALTRRHGGETR